MSKQTELNKKRVIGQLLLAAAVIATTLWTGVCYTKAQSQLVRWEAPTDLSNTPQSSAYPAIAADNFGNVHVMWSEDTNGQPLGPQDPSDSGNTLFYTRWNGTAWTTPIDVLYVPDDPVATYASVTADKKGYLHAVWTGVSNIYYSNAPVWGAESTHAWSPPVVIATNSARSSWESSIAVDNTGALHIVYATRGGEVGVYHVQSIDGGATWSLPTKISQPFDSLETSFSRVRVISDNVGRLHAVWGTTNFEGFGQSIYYTRSVDNGATWSNATQMAYLNPGDFDVSWPYVTAVGSDELHLIYDAAANKGRWERISRDGGASWSQAQFIIPEMEGINGYTIPLVDGNGQLHLIINMRPSATQKVGIYYSDWEGDRWSPVIPLANAGPMAETAHFDAATVLSGNEIHIVWNQVRGGEIWHMQGTIDTVKSLPVQTLPTATPTPAPTPTLATILAQNTEARHPLLSQAVVSNINTLSDSPLIPSFIVVIGFIVLIAVVVRWRQSHSRAN
jgi:hypothetical protein